MVLLCLLFGLFFAMACQPSNDKSAVSNNIGAEDSKEAMKISVGHYQKDSGCPNDTVPCAKINLRYFKAEGGPSGVSDSVNMQVRRLLIGMLNSTLLDSSLLAQNKAAQKDVSEAAKLFIKDYEKTAAEDAKQGIPTMGYEVLSDTMFIEVLPKFISMGISGSTYNGGAHPYGFVSLVTLDHQTGKQLKPNDFIADKAALLKIAEAKFKENRQLKPDEDLIEAGYFLDENDKFFLPANMALRTNGLYLLYNPYEIAAYVEGIIDFTIPYKDLGNTVKMNW